jgi:hypothetical protein
MSEPMVTTTSLAAKAFVFRSTARKRKLFGVFSKWPLAVAR